MGIDRIGKPGPPVAPASTEAIQPTAHVDRASFAQVAAETRPVSPATRPPLVDLVRRASDAIEISAPSIED
jgi:hypothetical protein